MKSAFNARLTRDVIKGHSSYDRIKSMATTEILLKVLMRKIGRGSPIPVDLQATLVERGIDVQAIINSRIHFNEDIHVKKENT